MNNDENKYMVIFYLYKDLAVIMILPLNYNYVSDTDKLSQD